MSSRLSPSEVGKARLEEIFWLLQYYCPCFYSTVVKCRVGKILDRKHKVPQKVCSQTYCKKTLHLRSINIKYRLTIFLCKYTMMNSGTC